MKYLLPCLLLCLFGCTREAAPIAFTMLQVNDVYELSPLEGSGGSEGGLARVATVLAELEQENPNTWMVLAGDMLSPSALGLAKITGPDGKSQRLSGKQIVSVMNKVGLDYMTFGNHEFDLKEPELLARLEESTFSWIASSVTRANGEMFPKSVMHEVLEVNGADGSVKVGMFSVMIDSNPKDYVKYRTDFLAVGEEQVAALRNKGAEIIIALTHQAMPDDQELATKVAGVDIVLGGHEHDAAAWTGENGVSVYKADANARTAYIHRFQWNPTTRKLAVRSELKKINDTVTDHPEVAAEVAQWEKLVFDAFAKQGFDLTQQVTVAGEDLDGTESAIRNGQTRLTRVLADGMLQTMSEAEAVIYNSGTIRIDDVIAKGKVINNYDILRVLPFGGDAALTEMTGALLIRTLNQGAANKGKGGFLQYAGIEGGPDAWTLGGKPIEADRTYTIAALDFLLTGLEENLEFLKAMDKEGNLIENTEGLTPRPKDQWKDVRACLISGLQDAFGNPQ